MYFMDNECREAKIWEILTDLHQNSRWSILDHNEGFLVMYSFSN